MTPLRQLVAVWAPPESRPEYQRRLGALHTFDPPAAARGGWLVAQRDVVAVADDDDLPRRSEPCVFVEGSPARSAPPPASTQLDAWATWLHASPLDVGAVAFDEATAVLCRSVSGRVPLYYAHTGDALLISTTLTELASVSRRALAPDLLVHAAWTGFTCEYPYGRTLLEGVRVVPSGHVARVTARGGGGVTCYWNPERAPREPPSPDVRQRHAQQLADLLQRCIRESFPWDGTGLVWLSGGVDSSSLAALAQAQGDDFATLSLLPPEPSAVRTRELEYVASAAPRARHRHVEDLDPERYAELPRRAPSRLVHCLHPAIPSTLELSAEHGYRCVMGGEFADIVCGGTYSSPDWTRDTPVGHLLPRIASGELAPRSALRWLKHWSLRAAGRPLVPFAAWLPECFSADVRAEYAAYRRDRQRAVASDPATNATLRAHMEAAEFPAMSWELLAPARVHRHFPFVSRTAFEWALQTHPTERFDPGTKRLLRAGLNGVVPARNLQRADKGAFGSRWPADPVRMPAIPVAFEGMFDERWLEATAGGRGVSLRESTVVGFLVAFEAASSRARSGGAG